MSEPDDLLTEIEALQEKLQQARDSITRQFIGQATKLVLLFIAVI